MYNGRACPYPARMVARAVTTFALLLLLSLLAVGVAVSIGSAGPGPLALWQDLWNGQGAAGEPKC